MSMTLLEEEKVPGRGMTLLEDAPPPAPVAGPEPSGYIEDQAGRRVSVGDVRPPGTSYVAQGATGRMAYLDASGRVQEGFVPGARPALAVAGPEPSGFVEDQAGRRVSFGDVRPPAMGEGTIGTQGRYGAPVGGMAEASAGGTPALPEESSIAWPGLAGEMPVSGMTQNAVMGAADGRLKPKWDAADIERAAAEAEPRKTLRMPYTKQEQDWQRLQERPLASQARDYATGGGLWKTWVEKPLLGMFGGTVVGKHVRNVANEIELRLHPSKYYSVVTGKRMGNATPTEVKAAALQTGLLKTDNLLLNTLGQDLPGFVLGGDALVASVPYVGFPMLNLMQQTLDNQLAVQKGEEPRWDLESLGESVVAGMVLEMVPLPKELKEGSGGWVKRLSQQFGSAGLKALELNAVSSVQGKQQTPEEFLSNFALMAGMRFPDAINAILDGQMVNRLVKNGLDAKAANEWVNRARAGDVRSVEMVNKYVEDAELSRAWGRANELRAEWRAKRDAAEQAETLKQKDLTARALRGDAAAKAELRRARGIPEAPKVGAERVGVEARRAPGLTPVLAGAPGEMPFVGETVRNMSKVMPWHEPVPGAAMPEGTPATGPGVAPFRFAGSGQLVDAYGRPVRSDMTLKPVAAAGTLPRGIASRLLSLPADFRAYPNGKGLSALRRDILKAITGTRPQESQAGAAVVRNALYGHFGITEGTTAEKDAAVEAALRGIVEARPGAPAAGAAGPGAVAPGAASAGAAVPGPGAPGAAAPAAGIAAGPGPGAGAPGPAAAGIRPGPLAVEIEGKGLPVVNLTPAPEAAPGAEWAAKTPLAPTEIARGHWAWVDLQAPVYRAAMIPEQALQAGLQSRNRNTAAAGVARRKRLKEFAAPDMLDAPYSNLGGPIVAADSGWPLAGYGRMGTLLDVWELPDNDPRKVAMLEQMTAQAATVGAGPRPGEMKMPVLVRVADRYENTNAKRFAEQSNTEVTQGYSPAEEAIHDSKVILSNDLLKYLNLPESGDLLAASNQDFLLRFLEVAGNKAGMIDEDGRLNAAMEMRVRKALVAMLVADSRSVQSIVANMVERADTYGIKDIVNGLAGAAAELVLLRKTRPEFDLTNELSGMMPELIAARQDILAGRVSSVQAYLQQQDFWNQTPDEIKRLVRIVDAAKSGAQLREGLKKYARLALKYDVLTGFLFDDIKPKQKIDFLDQVVRGIYGDKIDQAGPIGRGIKGNAGGKPEGGGGQPGVPWAGPGGRPEAAIAGGEQPGPAAAGPASATAGGGQVIPGGAPAGPAAGPVAAPGPKQAAARDDLERLLAAEEGGSGPGLVKEQGELFATLEGGAQKSEFIRMLEREGESGRGAMNPARTEELTVRGIGSLARRLLDAVAAGRINEAEAAERWRKGQAAMARALKVAQKPRAPDTMDMFEAPAREQGMLFEQAAVDEFAKTQGITDEKERSKVSNAFRQLDLFEDAPIAGKTAAGAGGGLFGRAGKAEEPELDPVAAQHAALLTPPDAKTFTAAFKATGGRISALVAGVLNRTIPAFAVEGKVIATPKDAATLALSCRSRLFEIYKVAVLDRETHKIVYSSVLTVGVKDASLVDPSLVVNAAILASRKSGLPLSRLQTIGIHNHPSGDPVPSPEDTKISRLLVAACKVAGVEHIDDLVTDGGTYYSRAEEGVGTFDEYAPLDVDMVRPEDLRQVNTPDILAPIAQALRQGNPRAFYAIFVNTKNKVIGIQQLEFADKKKVLEEIVLEAARTQAAGLIAVVPAEAETLEFGKELIQTGKICKLGVLDINSPDVLSWVRAGLLNFTGGAAGGMVGEGLEKSERLEKAYKSMPRQLQGSYDEFQHQTVESLAGLAQHELDLYEEGEETDIKTPAQALKIRKWMAALQVQEGRGAYKTGSALVDGAARLVASAAEEAGVPVTAELVQKLLGKYGARLEGQYGQIEQVAREMQAGAETDVWFGMKGGKLDEHGEAGKQDRGTAAEGGSRGRGRTDIKIAGGSVMVRPRESVGIGRYNIDEDQRLGANLALQRFEEGKKGFLLGDGTGVGKTAQELIIAQEFKARTGKDVLIVVPNTQIIDGSYWNDSKLLGIDLRGFDLSTYTAMRGKNGGPSKILKDYTPGEEGAREPIEAGKQYGLVILDEAHNLKNAGAQQTVRMMKVIDAAEHVLFATATPMDTPTGAAYFMSAITGIPKDRMARMLGFTIEEEPDGQGGYRERHALIPGYSWAEVKKNLVNLRNSAVAQGALIRREYPFIGQFEDLEFELTPEDMATERRIRDYYDAIMSLSPNRKYRGRVAGQKLHALSQWLEGKKAGMIFEQIKKSLAAGRRPIVVTQFVNPSDRLDRPEVTSKLKAKQAQMWDSIMAEMPPIDGTILTVKKMLDAAGIKHARIYGTHDKGAEVVRFQGGEVQVVLATAKSGGAGINLDDVVGDAPRDLILASTPFEGDVYNQVLGRVNRRNTVNAENTRILDVYARGMFSEERRRAINRKKRDILDRIQKGADIDLAAFDPEAEETDDEDLAAESDVGLEEDLAAESDVGLPEGELGEPKVKGSKAVLLPADDPEFSVLPLEFPELVAFGRQLLGGKFPVVARKLRNAWGRFEHRDLTGEGEIKLLAEIFELITPQEAARMSAEADEWAAAQGAQTPEEIKDLARARYRELYEQAFELAKTKNPLRASKVLAHEIGHVRDWMPGITHMIRGRGNILGHIAGFVDYVQKSLAALPSQQGNLLTPAERQEIRKQAQKKGKSDAAMVKRLYREQIEAELRRRGIVTVAEIEAELDPLIRWWRGSGDTLEKHFETAWEKYAEAMSVLLNNPEALAKRAPKFNKLIRGWMETRPEVAQRYNAMQDAINSGAIYKDRVETMYRDMEEADAAASEWAMVPWESTWREFKDRVRYAADRRFGPAQMRIATVDDARVRRRALGALSNSLYRGARGELIMDRVQMEVATRLKNNNFRWINFGEYLFHQRIFYGDRADLGNPWGMNPKASAERLAEMRRDYGPERYAALEEAALWLRNIYESEVLGPARKAGVYSPEMMKKLEDEVFYATFAVQVQEGRPQKNSIEALYENLFNTAGGQVTSHIKKQYGTLKPVKNPATATLQKMLAISSMIYRESAKYEACFAMRNSEFADEWRRAEKKLDKNTGSQKIVVVENARIGTLLYMRGGQMEGWYGPRSLVDAFSYDNPIEVELLAKAVSKGSRYIKAILASANPAFWPVAFVRDVRGFNRRMPGTATEVRNWVPMSGGVFGRYVLRAYEAARLLQQGKPNALGQAALRRGALISRAAGYMGMAADDEFEREIKRRGLPVVMEEDVSRLRQALNLGNRWLELGQVFERTVKIAGMMYMDEKYPEMDENLKMIIVRKWAGSPDFLEKGAANWAIDPFALFYNPTKESARSEVQAWKGFSGEPGRPGEMFWNTLRWTILPKLALGMLGYGLAAVAKRKLSDRSQFEAMYQDGPGERDKRAYQCWPLIWVDKKEHKALYFRWPMEENERMIGAATDIALQAALTGEAGDVAGALTDFAGRQLPGPNPLAKLGMDWLVYKLGGNPYDTFRGRTVLSQDEQAVRGLPGAAAMGRHTWNQTLGSLLGRLEDPAQAGDAPLTRAEKILRAPVIKPLLGRWLKIDNAGYRERLQAAATPIAKQEAAARLEINAVVSAMKETGQAPPADILVRLAQGKALADLYGDKPLPPDLAFKRWYYSHMAYQLKVAQESAAPVGIRLLRQQRTGAQKMSVAGEIIGELLPR